MRLLVLFLLVTVFHAAGQQLKDTTLQPVEIVHARERPRLENETEIDSLALHLNVSSSLGTILGENSPVYIKSYGTGTNTISIRGTGSTQNKVYWNGLPISSPLSSSSDLSLIPGFALSKVSINYAGINYGSGNFGGALILTSSADYEKGSEAEFSMGSFSTCSNVLKARHSSASSFGVTTIYTQVSKNNFPFTNYVLAGSPKEKLKHAEYFQGGLLHTENYKLSNYTHIIAAAWIQHSFHNLPPIMLVPASSESQEDEFLRFTANLIKQKGKDSLNIHFGNDNEVIHYTNLLAAMDTRNQFNRYQAFATNLHIFDHRIRVKGKLEAILDRGLSPGFTGYSKRMSYGGLIGADYSPFPKWMINASAREEIIDFKYYNIDGSFGATVSPSRKYLSIFFSATRDHNFPSLIDFYWIPGGNPFLKPEYSSSANTGINIYQILHGTEFRFKGTVYSNLIDDYIQWSPGNSGYWTPANVKQVRVKGIELSINADGKFGRFSLMPGGFYSFTSSVISASSIPGDRMVGKQLNYVPNTKASAFLRVLTKKEYLELRWNFTGERLAPDGALARYSLTDLKVTKQFDKKKYSIRLQADCNNIFNVEYQSIAWRPMPGRWYQIHFIFNLI